MVLGAAQLLGSVEPHWVVLGWLDLAVLQPEHYPLVGRSSEHYGAEATLPWPLGKYAQRPELARNVVALLLPEVVRIDQRRLASHPPAGRGRMVWRSEPGLRPSRV